MAHKTAIVRIEATALLNALKASNSGKYAIHGLVPDDARLVGFLEHVGSSGERLLVFRIETEDHAFPVITEGKPVVLLKRLPAEM